MLLLKPVPILHVGGVNMRFLTNRAYLKKNRLYIIKETLLQNIPVVLMSFNTNNYLIYLSDSFPESNNQYKIPEGF